MEYDEFNLIPIGVTQPAAGAEFSYKFPAGAIYHIKGILFTFVTDATVANRLPQLQFKWGGTFLGAFNAVTQQAATNTHQYMAGPALPASAAGPNFDYIPLPEGFCVRGETVLSTVTTLIKAGDQYSAITLYVYVEPTSDDYNLGS